MNEKNMREPITILDSKSSMDLKDCFILSKIANFKSKSKNQQTSKLNI